MPDDYRAAVAELAMNRATLAMGATNPPPEAAAKANRIARRTGLPVATVDANLADLDLRVRVAEARLLMQRSPQFASWMANPRNAAVAAGDVDAMGRAIPVWRALPAPTPTLFNAAKGIWTSLYEGGVQMRASLYLATDDWLPDIIPTSGTSKQYYRDQNQREILAAQALIDQATPDFKSDTARYLYGSASSLAQMAPSIAASFLAGPEAGLAIAAIQAGLPAYGKYRARGATATEALAGGLLEGTIEAATEKLPLGWLVNKLGKVGMGKFVSGYLGRELLGEAAATVGQNAVDTAIANPGKSWWQFLTEQPDQLIQTAVTTLVAGGFFAGVHRAAQRFGGPDGTAGMDAATAVDRAMAMAADSKVRALDPEAYRDFVSRFTEGSAAENLYIPAQALRDHFQAHDIAYRDDEFWQHHAAQIDQGVATGGDVVIPTADAAAHIAGTPVWDAVRGDTRVSPGGASLNELESRRAEYEAAMERAGAETRTQIEADRAADAPRQRIVEDIRTKLANAGYAPAEAHVAAELAASRFATRAARMGRVLTGDETQHLRIEAVLPESLAPVVAEDARDPASGTLGKVIGAMRRGSSSGRSKYRAAAQDLAQILERRGLDPATAGDAEIRGALAHYQHQASGPDRFVVADGRIYRQNADPHWRSNVDRVVRGDQLAPLIRVGRVTALLEKHGLNAGDVYFTRGKLGLVKSKHGLNLPLAVLHDLPQLLRTPDAIFPSGKGDGSIIVAVPAVDRNNDPVIVAMTPDRDGHNVVLSVYGKSESDEGVSGRDWIASQIARARKEGLPVYEKVGSANLEPKPGPAEATPTPSGPIPAGGPAKPSRPILSVNRDVKKQEQSGNAGPRGQITFRNGQATIQLFQSRDASTFVHELGHLGLEELMEDAHAADAPDRLRADWDIVTAWFAGMGHQVVDGHIPVAAHEMWARGFERYLMEGKAPSTALARVFATFKTWLTGLYRTVGSLRAPISPEIREVMDRLLATDAEIAEARGRQQVADLFDTAATARMSEPEFAAYRKLSDEARDAAHSQLLDKTMATIRAARTAEWQREAAGMRDQVTAEIDQRPDFRARDLLARPDGVRLDRHWLVEHYGEDLPGQLPEGAVAEAGGAHPDDVAAMAGLPDGDALVRSLVTTEAQQRAMAADGDPRPLRQALIDEQTDHAMRARHGDPLTDGSIAREAIAAVQNDLQGETMAAELRALARRSGGTPLPYSMAKDWARDRIAAATVDEATSGGAIERHARAAAKAGEAARAALAKGDADSAFRHKQAQMLNNALVAEAGRMHDAVGRARDRLHGYARRSRPGAIGQEALDRIHDLLEQVGLREPGMHPDDRPGFEQWAAARAAEGRDIVVPPGFADALGDTSWSRQPVDRLLALDDLVHQVAHLGRLDRVLDDGGTERDLGAVVDEALKGIAALPARQPIAFDPDWGARLKANVEAIDAGLLKVETIVDWLDGGKRDGVFNRILFRPIAEAQARERDLSSDVFRRFREAMQQVPDVARWAERVTLPELADPDTGAPLNLARQRLVAMALNMGNEDNIARLTRGYRWSRDAVMAALHREMAPDDWRFVQRVWGITGSLAPDIAAMERRVNGIAPGKLIAQPIETSGGAIRGGWYPAIPDASRDPAGPPTVPPAAPPAGLLAADYVRATSRAADARDRIDQLDRPVLLDLGVINRHLGEVIHDITHRAALIDAQRLIASPAIARAIDGTLGPAIRKQLQPWLSHVANQWAAERAANEGLGRFMGKLRANVTAAGMGFRLATVITQVSGFANAQEVTGGTWLPRAIAQSAAHPIDSFRFAMEKSGEVRHWMDTLDRDVGALMRSIDTSPLRRATALPDAARRFLYHGIGYAERMVVVPSWIAAYNKAIAGGAAEPDAVYAADKAIRQAQGSGAAKDLAAIQRGDGPWGEALKLSTMFYSYMSAVYQRQRTLGRDVAGAVRERRAHDLPGLMARAWWLIAVPPLLSQLLAGKGPDQDEDWGLWSFKTMLVNALGPIPFVRDAIEPAWDRAAGKQGSGYRISPLQAVGETLVDLTGDAGALARGDPTKHATKDAIAGVGYATGLVPTQLADAAQFLVDVGQGEQSPETVADWYRGLSTGKIHNT